MKEMNDDELQQWLDGKSSVPENISTNEDAEAYRNLFKALNTEPEKGLPFNFAAKVTRKIATEQKHNNELKLNLIAAAIFIGLISLVCGAIIWFKPDTAAKLPSYKWLILFCPILFIAIQYLDQKLVKSNIFKRP